MIVFPRLTSEHHKDYNLSPRVSSPPTDVGVLVRNSALGTM